MRQSLLGAAAAQKPHLGIRATYPHDIGLRGQPAGDSCATLTPETSGIPSERLSACLFEMNSVSQSNAGPDHVEGSNRG